MAGHLVVSHGPVLLPEGTAVEVISARLGLVIAPAPVFGENGSKRFRINDSMVPVSPRVWAA
jgi:hypothetical protein